MTQNSMTSFMDGPLIDMFKHLILRMGKLENDAALDVKTMTNVVPCL